MQYILMDYVRESGWTELTKADQALWLGAYCDYLVAMKEAGVLKSGTGLQPTMTAKTVRQVDGDAHVLDGPYADSKEQIGGFHLIDVADLDAAIYWARHSPTSLHGVVEVRSVMEHSDDPEIQKLIDTSVRTLSPNKLPEL